MPFNRSPTAGIARVRLRSSGKDLIFEILYMKCAHPPAKMHRITDALYRDHGRTTRNKAGPASWTGFSETGSPLLVTGCFCHKDRWFKSTPPANKPRTPSTQSFEAVLAFLRACRIPARSARATIVPYPAWKSDFITVASRRISETMRIFPSFAFLASPSGLGLGKR